MLARLRAGLQTSRLWILGVVALVLVGAAALGSRASVRSLILPCLGIGVAILLQWPIAGLFALLPAALLVPIEFGTGTEVGLNAATLLIPFLLALWVLDMMRRQELRLVPSRTNRPLILFLVAGLLSLLVGNAYWDPSVPRPGNFTLVQLAQWAIVAFSAGAFWLTGNLVREEAWLRRLTFLFLALAGGLAILRVMPATRFDAQVIATLALDRSPFWLLLAALAGGQLLFNRTLALPWRLFLLVTEGACLVYVFFLERDTLSHVAGTAAVLGVLAWLRWPRLRRPALLLIVALASTGVLFSSIYQFAGGDAEWTRSGNSRLALIGRVIEMTMRNPITGLGPAAYRPYSNLEPLVSGTLWFDFVVSSHNNYVDLFAHFGLLGMGLFAWFAAEVTILGFRLRAALADGFAAGYVNAMLAAWAGALTVMLLADWILPFVYNIGFPGFQASVLVWLFLGGLVALEQCVQPHDRQQASGAETPAPHPTRL
jgi:hypothetical protein